MNKLSTKTKKNLFTLLAGIICCMATFTVTSCSVDDSAIYPDEDIDYEVTGKWVANLGPESGFGEDYICHVMLSFDDDGIVRTMTYEGEPDAPIDDIWFEKCHNVYIFDKAKHTLKVVNSYTYGLPDNATYKLEDGNLVLRDEDYDTEYIFHRPTYEEKEKFYKYDEEIYSAGYNGAWVRSYEENGQKNYVVFDYYVTCYVTRFTVTASGQVYRTNESRRLDYDEDTRDDPKISIYEPGSSKDYKEYWWKTEGVNLYLGYYGSDETLYTYHQMTKDEWKMFHKFNETAIISNLKEQLAGSTWGLESCDNNEVATNQSNHWTYDADGTVYFTPSIDVMKSLGIWGHDFKGTYTINGNIVEQQAAVDDKNTLFTQKMNVQMAVNNELESTTDVETFVDGKSVYVSKGMSEVRYSELYDYSSVIPGKWEGYLWFGQDGTYEIDKLYRFEFKDDGTFSLYTQDDQEQWVETERTTSQYFIINNMLYMRWQDAGSDEMIYQGWNVFSFNSNTKLEFYAFRNSPDGKRKYVEIDLNKIE